MTVMLFFEVTWNGCGIERAFAKTGYLLIFFDRLRACAVLSDRRKPDNRWYHWDELSPRGQLSEDERGMNGTSEPKCDTF